MRVPLSWLRELVAFDVSAEELAERLSMTGTAVDVIDRLETPVAGVVAARVVSVEDVPESDKLCVVALDAGPAGQGQVVAGARNLAAGDVVAWAKPGSRVTTVPELGVRTMAGRYESQGMVCSADELGISEDRYQWIVLLPPEAEPGADVVSLLGLDDAVFELEIYPNRPDLLSVLGVAREVALLYDTQLREPWIEPVEDGPPASSSTSVEIEDLSACPRYLARVISDVTFRPSPALVQARLHASGFRPLGNLVDATNYVLLLCGQPLHAFDLDKLGEQRIVVRRARLQERLQTLDGAERLLDAADLVIADATDAQAIAGVMGGGQSEVGTATTRVLLESAYFDPSTIARTGRRHKMLTEASRRFERGADPEAVPKAASLCAELIRRWAGGRIAQGAVDVGGPPERRRVTLRLARPEAILGVKVSAEEIDRYLGGLGCDASRSDGSLDVTVPSWRPDLEREIDLVEEIARLYGYDAVPLTMPTGQRGHLTREQRYGRRIRETVLGAGFSEAALTSFLAPDDLPLTGGTFAIRVANPMTVEQTYLRPTLVPGLLRAARHNAAHGVTSIRLFEMGVAFVAWPSEESRPVEELRLGAVVAGHAGGDAWHAPARDFDAYDASGLVELVMSCMGIRGWELGECDDYPFHPGRSASVVVDGTAVGRFGEVRPSVRKALDLPGGVAAIELALDALMTRAASELKVRELARFPAITRDISLDVDEDVPAAEVEATIRRAAGESLESVVLLNVYRGEPVASGRRNLLYRLTLRVSDRTLTSEEADQVRNAVVEAVAAAHGADVR